MSINNKVRLFAALALVAIGAFFKLSGWEPTSDEPGPEPTTPWGVICDDPETILAQTFDLLAVTIDEEAQGEENVFSAKCYEVLFGETPTLRVDVTLKRPKGHAGENCIEAESVVAQVVNDLQHYAPMKRRVTAVVHCTAPDSHRARGTDSAHYDPTTKTIENHVF